MGPALAAQFYMPGSKRIAYDASGCKELMTFSPSVGYVFGCWGKGQTSIVLIYRIDRSHRDCGDSRMRDILDLDAVSSRRQGTIIAAS